MIFSPLWIFCPCILPCHLHHKLLQLKYGFFCFLFFFNYSLSTYYGVFVHCCHLNHINKWKTCLTWPLGKSKNQNQFLDINRLVSQNDMFQILWIHTWPKSASDFSILQFCLILFFQNLIHKLVQQCITSTVFQQQTSHYFLQNLLF